jgi:hypothetical protein
MSVAISLQSKLPHEFEALERRDAFLFARALWQHGLPKAWADVTERTTQTIVSQAGPCRSPFLPLLPLESACTWWQNLRGFRDTAVPQQSCLRPSGHLFTRLALKKLPPFAHGALTPLTETYLYRRTLRARNEVS